MRSFQSLSFDPFTIIKVSYEGGLHMPPHTDDESKISIVLDGSLIEKASGNCVEARRNCVVIKPNLAVHENLFGRRGAGLLTVCFKEGFTLPDELETWRWAEDPQLCLGTYKLWYSAKSVRNDAQLNRLLHEFIQPLRTTAKTQRAQIPAWLHPVAQSLSRYSLDVETIEALAERLKISRVHLSRSFKKHYSIPAVQYRLYGRFNHLLHCLVSTNKPLAEISYECGFSDQSQMSRLVLKETGYTPKALRLLLQKF